MLSDGSRISYLKKTAALEQEQSNTKENKLSVELFPNPSDGNFELEILNDEFQRQNIEVRTYNVNFTNYPYGEAFFDVVFTEPGHGEY